MGLRHPGDHTTVEPRDLESGVGNKLVYAPGKMASAADHALNRIQSRCPHMGFPLDRGTVQGCILTCQWHHARFDLETGGTFDQWADDVRVFPMRVENGALLVDVANHGDRRQHFLRRLLPPAPTGIRVVYAEGYAAFFIPGQIHNFR